MAISRPISFTKINNELSLGNSLGNYRGEFFLHVPTNSARIIAPNMPISMSSLEGCTVLGDNLPVTPNIELRSQSPLTQKVGVRQGGTTTMAVQFDSLYNISPQPVLTFPVEQNVDNPRVRWYETTGGGFTAVNASEYKTEVVATPGPGTGSSLRVTSVLTISTASAGSRTFVAVGEVYTSRMDQANTPIVATNSQQFPGYEVIATVGAAPTATPGQGTIYGKPNPYSRTIITYTNGDPTFYPEFSIWFLARLYGFNVPPGQDNRHLYDYPDSQNGWVATGGAYWHRRVMLSTDGGLTETDVSAQFSNEDVQLPDFGPSLIGYQGWQKVAMRKKYTVAYEHGYRYRPTITRRRQYIDPTGSTVTLSTVVQVPTFQVNILEKTVDNAIPTLLSVVIDRDQVQEEPGDGTFNVTVTTQHAQGKGFIMTSTDPNVIPGNWNPRLIIDKDEQTYTLGGGGVSRLLSSNQGQDRTLFIGAKPYEVGEWSSNDEILDSITIKNMGAMEKLSSTGVDRGTVDEGESFTFTVAGINFPTAQYGDWTWETTFPADTVSATSGIVNVPYSGDRFTGNYHGTFTVDTLARPLHYEDVTGGRIKVFYNGKLFAQTGANLKIRNTTALPVTLPTAVANPTHHVHVKAGARGEYVSNYYYATVTLNTDGTYTRNNDVFNPGPKVYASPQPLEGDWKPRVTGHGQVSKTVSYEDYLFGVKPSGAAQATASFSGGTASLKLQTIKLRSAMAHAVVSFDWEFYNTASGDTRPGGTISCSIMVDSIPTGPGIIDVGIGGESGIVGEDPFSLGFVVDEPVGGEGIVISDPDVHEPLTGTTIDQGTGQIVEDTNTTTVLNAATSSTTTITSTTTDSTTTLSTGSSIGTILVTSAQVAAATEEAALAASLAEKEAMGTDYEPGSASPVTVVKHPTLGTLLRSFCQGTTKMGVYANGAGGSYNAVIKVNSTDCGYVAPIKTTEAVTVTNAVAQYNEAEIQESIDAALAELGVIDLSDILAGINIGSFGIG